MLTMIPESYVSSMQWSLDIAAVFWATNVSDRWDAFPVSKAARQPGSHEAGHDCWSRLAAAIVYGRFLDGFPCPEFVVKSRGSSKSFREPPSDQFASPWVSCSTYFCSRGASCISDLLLRPPGPHFVSPGAFWTFLKAF